MRDPTQTDPDFVHELEFIYEDHDEDEDAGDDAGENVDGSFTFKYWHSDHSTLSWACTNGHCDIVRLLLVNDRVNPAAGDCFAFREAAAGGHVNIVRLLLTGIFSHTFTTVEISSSSS
jgi:hypothetical protein